jgi:hypothetical protein
MVGVRSSRGRIGGRRKPTPHHSWSWLQFAVLLAEKIDNKSEIESSIWREEIQNRNRLLDFGGKKFKVESTIDSALHTRGEYDRSAVGFIEYIII